MMISKTTLWSLVGTCLILGSVSVQAGPIEGRKTSPKSQEKATEQSRESQRKAIESERKAMEALRASMSGHPDERAALSDLSSYMDQLKKVEQQLGKSELSEADRAELQKQQAELSKYRAEVLERRGAQLSTYMKPEALNVYKEAAKSSPDEGFKNFAAGMVARSEKFKPETLRKEIGRSMGEAARQMGLGEQESATLVKSAQEASPFTQAGLKEAAERISSVLNGTSTKGENGTERIGMKKGEVESEIVKSLVASESRRGSSAEGMKAIANLLEVSSNTPEGLRARRDALLGFEKHEAEQAEGRGEGIAGAFKKMSDSERNMLKNSGVPEKEINAEAALRAELSEKMGSSESVKKLGTMNKEIAEIREKLEKAIGDNDSAAVGKLLAELRGKEESREKLVDGIKSDVARTLSKAKAEQMMALFGEGGQAWQLAKLYEKFFKDYTERLMSEVNEKTGEKYTKEQAEEEAAAALNHLACDCTGKKKSIGCSLAQNWSKVGAFIASGPGKALISTATATMGAGLTYLFVNNDAKAHGAGEHSGTTTH